MSSKIRLIVGLGNPGANYVRTRHNSGAWLVNQLMNQANASWKTETRFNAELGRVQIGNQDIRLVFPLTFMNRSGQSVGAVSAYFNMTPEEILVVHDELDLPPGQVRLKQGGGHGGHNGLRDIISVLGSKDFWRLRIGIGHPGSRDQVTNYVLGAPAVEDLLKIEQVIEQAVKLMPRIVTGEFQQVMNDLHRHS